MYSEISSLVCLYMLTCTEVYNVRCIRAHKSFSTAVVGISYVL
jgi:putative component of membrane protein insertase Oxa1/YidC/SpoIIIJ protein YidD